MRALPVAQRPRLLTIVFGADETYQYMSVKGMINEKLAKFMEGAELLFGPARSLCPTRCATTRRRTILRQSLVQTCQIHVEHPHHPLHETFAIPPKLIATTTAAIVLTAMLHFIESVISGGQPLLNFLRDSTFEMVLFILCVDQAAYNGLAFKFLLCLQLLLLPSVNFFLWMEPCGLHQGVRALLAHVDRCDHKKLLRACSRVLKQGKNHDKLCDVIPRMIHFKAQFHLGPPPYVDSSATPECKAFLVKLMLLSERQKLLKSKDPVKALDESRRKFHLDSVMSLLNFTLLGDMLIHYCAGVGCCPRGGRRI